MMKKEVILYQKADGTYPVQDFLDSFLAKVSKKITWVTSLVEDLEHVPAQYFSKLTDTNDIWEFRIKL